MGDIFDQIAAEPVGTGTAGGGSDVFDAIATEKPVSDMGAVRSAGLRGIGSIFGLVDEFLPQFSRSEGISAPHIFGLFSRKNDAPTMQGDYTKVMTDAGLITDEKPATEKGKYLADVAENAGAAGPFGPLAALLSGVSGGTGAYIGEKVGGPTGKTVGSIVGNLTPTALQKSGILKEVADYLGPTISELPGIRSIFGGEGGATDRAIGRALRDATGDNADDVVETLKNTQADDFSKFKTIDEVSGDTGLSRVKDAVASEIPSSPFKTLSDERAAARSGAVSKVQSVPEGTTSYGLSKSLEGGLAESGSKAAQVESAFWENVPKEVSVPMGDKLQEMAQSINEMNLGVIPENSKIEGLFKMLSKGFDDGEMSLGQIQAIRQRAGELSRSYGSSSVASEREVGKMARVIADKLAESVDDAAAAGSIPQDAADIWRKARTETFNRVDTFGKTKATQLATEGEALDNTKLLSEGLQSPDKMRAHIDAGDFGGVDVRPTYRQALVSILEDAPQSKWADILANRADQFGQVFTADELKQLAAAAADKQAEMKAVANASVGNSMTAPRLNVKEFLSRYKGAAGLPAVVNNALPLGLAAEGARRGYKEADNPVAGVANATRNAILGFIAGKAIRAGVRGARDRFDEGIIEAFQNPGKAAQLMEEAGKPSGIRKALTDAAVGAGENAALQGTYKGITSMFGARPNEIDLGGGVYSVQDESKKEQPKNQETEDQIRSEINSDPYFKALSMTESGGNENAKNPESSASGEFQLIKSTAKALGVKDVFNLRDNFEATKRLTDEHRARFGDDPEMLYSAHFLGGTVLAKYLAGKPLTPDEKRRVNDLQTKALPRFRKFYNSESA